LGPWFRAGALAALALAGGALPAKPMVARPQDKQWVVSEFTWVKLVPKEAGAPGSAHPAVLDDGFLASRLGSIRIPLDQDARGEALFAKDELDSLVEPLRQAFAQAGPDEDLLLVSTNRRGASFLAKPKAVTARLFSQDGSLQVIVHDARFQFMDELIGGHIQPTFTFGSRSAASGQQLTGAGALGRRADWLAFPIQTAPVAAPQVAPAFPAAAVPVPAPLPARDEAFFAQQALRLRGLKQLRDQGLLSEAEYQEKRLEILNGL
jgi:hypothetical protein